MYTSTQTNSKISVYKCDLFQPYVILRPWLRHQKSLPFQFLSPGTPRAKICSKMVHPFLKYRVNKFGNGRTNNNIMPPARYDWRMHKKTRHFLKNFRSALRVLSGT